MLHAGGNFANSVIRNYTVKYGVCKFLLVFHCNYTIWLYLILFLRCSMLNNGVPLNSVLGVIQGHWMSSIVTSWQITYDILSVRRCNHSSNLYGFWVIWYWIISWPWNLGWGHPRSSEIAPFNRPHTSTYWHSIVTMALSCTVSEIVRYWFL